MSDSSAAVKATANLCCVVLMLAGCAQNGVGPELGISTISAPPPGPAPTPTTQTFVYPEKGQSAKQQEFDRGQCYSWAVQQSGFDPANPPAAPPPPPQTTAQGGMFRGAFGGAALGAVGGAIGGNAGEGAAVGAAVGGLFGLMRRAAVVEQDQQAQASYEARQRNAMIQGRSAYNRAFGVCMNGRGYSVS